MADLVHWETLLSDAAGPRDHTIRFPAPLTITEIHVLDKDQVVQHKSTTITGTTTPSMFKLAFAVKRLGSKEVVILQLPAADGKPNFPYAAGSSTVVPVRTEIMTDYMVVRGVFEAATLLVYGYLLEEKEFDLPVLQDEAELLPLNLDALVIPLNIFEQVFPWPELTRPQESISAVTTAFRHVVDGIENDRLTQENLDSVDRVVSDRSLFWEALQSDPCDAWPDIAVFLQYALEMRHLLHVPARHLLLSIVNTGVLCCQTIFELPPLALTATLLDVNIHQHLLDLVNNEVISDPLVLRALKCLNAATDRGVCMRNFIDATDGYLRLVEALVHRNSARVTQAIKTLMQKLHVYHFASLVAASEERTEEDVLESLEGLHRALMDGPFNLKDIGAWEPSSWANEALSKNPREIFLRCRTFHRDANLQLDAVDYPENLMLLLDELNLVDGLVSALRLQNPVIYGYAVKIIATLLSSRRGFALLCHDADALHALHQSLVSYTTLIDEVAHLETPALNEWVKLNCEVMCSPKRLSALLRTHCFALEGVRLVNDLLRRPLVEDDLWLHNTTVSLCHLAKLLSSAPSATALVYALLFLDSGPLLLDCLVQCHAVSPVQNDATELSAVKKLCIHLLCAVLRHEDAVACVKHWSFECLHSILLPPTPASLANAMPPSLSSASLLPETADLVMMDDDEDGMGLLVTWVKPLWAFQNSDANFITSFKTELLNWMKRPTVSVPRLCMYCHLMNSLTLSQLYCQFPTAPSLVSPVVNALAALVELLEPAGSVTAVFSTEGPAVKGIGNMPLEQIFEDGVLPLLHFLLKLVDGMTLAQAGDPTQRSLQRARTMIPKLVSLYRCAEWCLAYDWNCDDLGLSGGYDSVLRAVRKDIVTILSVFVMQDAAKPTVVAVAPTPLDNDAAAFLAQPTFTWQTNVVQYILVELLAAPCNFRAGLSLLSDLLPIPLPLPKPSFADANLFLPADEAHFGGIDALQQHWLQWRSAIIAALTPIASHLESTISTLSRTCSQQTHVLLRRVCCQLIDLSPLFADTVLRPYLRFLHGDVADNAPQHGPTFYASVPLGSRALHILSGLAQVPSGAAAMILYNTGLDKTGNVQMNLIPLLLSILNEPSSKYVPVRCALEILRSMCTLKSNLPPVDTDDAEVAVCFDPEDVEGSCLALQSHLDNFVVGDWTVNEVVFATLQYLQRTTLVDEIPWSNILASLAVLHDTVQSARLDALQLMKLLIKLNCGPLLKHVLQRLVRAFSQAREDDDVATHATWLISFVRMLLIMYDESANYQLAGAVTVHLLHWETNNLGHPLHLILGFLPHEDPAIMTARQLIETLDDFVIANESSESSQLARDTLQFRFEDQLDWRTESLRFKNDANLPSLDDLFENRMVFVENGGEMDGYPYGGQIMAMKCLFAEEDEEFDLRLFRNLHSIASSFRENVELEVLGATKEDVSDQLGAVDTSDRRASTDSARATNDREDLTSQSHVKLSTQSFALTRRFRRSNFTSGRALSMHVDAYLTVPRTDDNKPPMVDESLLEVGVKSAPPTNGQSANGPSKRPVPVTTSNQPALTGPPPQHQHQHQLQHPNHRQHHHPEHHYQHPPPPPPPQQQHHHHHHHHQQQQQQYMRGSARENDRFVGPRGGSLRGMDSQRFHPYARRDDGRDRDRERERERDHERDRDDRQRSYRDQQPPADLPPRDRSDFAHHYPSQRGIGSRGRGGAGRGWTPRGPNVAPSQGEYWSRR